mgnify:CR=1 FL=1
MKIRFVLMDVFWAALFVAILIGLQVVFGWL